MRTGRRLPAAFFSQTCWRPAKTCRRRRGPAGQGWLHRILSQMHAEMRTAMGI
jgi:hypothetical protein